MARVVALMLACWLQLATGRDLHHSHARKVDFGGGVVTPANPLELEPEYWRAEAAAALAQQQAAGGAGGSEVARSVVLFLGDGMSLPTIAAARALLGQRRNRTGEETRLAFEDFPTVGLAKTYCVDAQTPDSACTATAYLCGVKNNYGTIGVTAAVRRGDCSAAADVSTHVASIAAWALDDGRDVGIVTTTRVTHASPAGTYAHTAERDWESDADVAADCAGDAAPRRQHDIALQLIHAHPGNRFKVILGGGRREFLPNTTVDEEGDFGRRLDGRNLINEWAETQESRGLNAQYVWNRDQVLAATAAPPDALLGLFESSHLQYNLETDKTTEPSLAELTEAAIAVLARNPRGFFLFVEGGRIDQAHHDNLPRLALDETVELSAAVARAADLLPAADALLIVTADHGHVLSYNGYARRGRDVLGPSDDRDLAGVPYMTLSYSNGPGFRPHLDGGLRADITQYNYEESRFPYEAGVPLEDETHGAEDVAVFARGAGHALLAGHYEQSALPRRAAAAACLGPAPLPPHCTALHRTATH